MEQQTEIRTHVARDLRLDPSFNRDLQVLGSRALIEVDVVPLEQVVAGVVLPRGLQRAIVFESEIAGLEANMMQTEQDHEDFAIATRQHQLAYKREIEQAVADAVGRGGEASAEDRSFIEKTVWAEHSDSPQGYFYRNTGRDLKPLRSLRVIDRLPPPGALPGQQAQTDALTQANAAAFAAAFRDVVLPAMQPSTAAAKK